MIVLNGKSVFKGIAIGKISFYKKKNQQIKRYKVEDCENEVLRFENAKDTAVGELKGLYEKALKDVGEANAMIFEIHQMMLEDLDYVESIINIINTEQVNAEYAVSVTSANFQKMFSSMDDEYMRGRAADVKDVSERLIDILLGSNKENNDFDEPVIIAADDLAPSETVQLDKSKVLGFVTAFGSSNSHTAILARTMSIPAIIGVGEALSNEYDGKKAVVDGFGGTIYIEPNESVLNEFIEKKKEEEERKLMLQKLKGKENVTIDGKNIMLYANAGSVGDIGLALQNDAYGIGLFRSEFLYLESDDFPTEECQFSAYREAAQNMAGKKVIIRTLDIGADKQADYFNLPHEENPAMGYRAIRICLEQTDIFKTQLRALLRASAFGNIAIMLPMITSLEEVLKAKKIINEVKSDLKADGIAFNENIEIGVMIETPAAVMISDLLAKEVDFFSIGTNDLTQYSLAADRQNQRIEKFFSPHHISILRMIKMVTDNAHKNGIWAGICGELGADTDLTELFLSIGVDELSVSPSMILNVREKIINTDISKVKDDVLNKFL